MVIIETNNNKYNVTNKEFRKLINSYKDELGLFDSIYFLENDFSVWYDYIIECLSDFYDFDENEEIKNKDYIKKKISEIVHY